MCAPFLQRWFRRFCCDSSFYFISACQSDNNGAYNRPTERSAPSWRDSSIERTLHRNRRGQGSNPRSCLSRCYLSNTISVGMENISPSQQARNLGVIFDDTMSFSPHVNTIVKGALYHIRNISKIRKYISKVNSNSQFC